MSTTSTQTTTYSYTSVDIENVVRRFTTDILMIADSSKSLTRDKAREYGEDVATLAKAGYLKSVDVTLLSAGKEVRAVRYSVKTGDSDLGADRPGGVRWPEVDSPYLRIILSYNSSYTDERKAAMASKLNISWTPSSADTTHASLTSETGRDYSSNGFGMARKDYK